jgi:hypothetical protein
MASHIHHLFAFFCTKLDISGVGKEKRKISDHRLQTIDFLIKRREAVSRLSIVLSREFFGINIEKSTASLYNRHFS